jgi:cobalt-zinc-cadmium efflux system outer membrane protein
MRGQAIICCAAALALFAVASAPAADTVTVADAVAKALAHSPSAQAAVFERSAAAARERAANAAYAPEFAVKSELGRSTGFDEKVTNGGITSALVGVETTLLDGGFRDAQLAAARARLRSAAAIEHQRRADVAFATRSAYFAALAARQEERARDEAAQTLQAYAALLERQTGLGFATSDEFLRAQLAVKDAETARRTAAAGLAAALQDLGSLTGTAFGAAALVDPPLEHAADPTVEQVDAAPIVVDARGAEEAARREADAARSEQRAQVKVSADAGALGVPFASTFRDHGGGEFLFGLSVPLFDGGARANRLAAALAAASAAEAQAEETRRTLVLGLERARLEKDRAEADVASARRAVPLAAEQFELLRARYLGGGSVRLLEVLDALTQRVEARLGVPRAEHAYRLALASEAQLLGRTSDP